jgi:hypothetical protein
MVGVGCVITRAALSPSDTADIFGKQLNISRTKDDDFISEDLNQVKSYAPAIWNALPVFALPPLFLVSALL